MAPRRRAIPPPGGDAITEFSATDSTRSANNKTMLNCIGNNRPHRCSLADKVENIDRGKSGNAVSRVHSRRTKLN